MKQMPFTLPVIAGPGSKVPDNIKDLGKVDISPIITHHEYAKFLFDSYQGKAYKEKLLKLHEDLVAFLWSHWVSSPTTAWRLTKDKNAFKIIAYQCKELPFSRNGHKLYLTPHNTKFEGYELRFDDHLIQQSKKRIDGYKEYNSCPEYDRHFEPFARILLNTNLELKSYKGQDWLVVYREGKSYNKETKEEFDSQWIEGYLPLDPIKTYNDYIYARTFLLPGMDGTPEHCIIKLYAPELLPLIEKNIKSSQLPDKILAVIDKANHGMCFLDKRLKRLKL